MIEIRLDLSHFKIELIKEQFWQGKALPLVLHHIM